MVGDLLVQFVEKNVTGELDVVFYCSLNEWKSLSSVRFKFDTNVSMYTHKLTFMHVAHWHT